jgi:GDP-L-fucose synthase
MILITGGTGFVGRHLQEELVRRSVPFAVFGSGEYDLADPVQADAVFARYAGAQLVVHLACYQAAGDFPAKHPAAQFHVNNLIHANVLEAWRRHSPRARLVGIGSSCAYPSGLATLTEDRLLDGPIQGALYAYGFTKRALHQGLAAYNDQYGLNGSYIVPATLFGEYDDFHLDTAHVVGALVGKFVAAAREGREEVEIWGDGSQVRDFLYAGNFVAALLDLAPRLDREVLNVAPGKGTSIREIATAIAAAAGFTGRIVYNPERYVGVREKFLDAARLADRYGMRLDADVSTGIRRTVDWYRQHFEAVHNRPKFARAATLRPALS